VSDHILAQCGCGSTFELLLGRTLIVLQNGDGRIVDAEVKCPQCGIPRTLEKVDHYKAPPPGPESDLSALAAYDQARHRLANGSLKFPDAAHAFHAAVHAADPCPDCRATEQ
jgi:hypothetical protein